MTASDLITLVSGESEIVFSTTAHTPTLSYWGPRISDSEQNGDISMLLSVGQPQNDSDIAGVFGIWREHARGQLGRPTVVCHRDGKDFSPLFRLTNTEVTENRVVFVSNDDGAGIEVTAEFEALGSGVFRATYRLTNTADQPLTVNDMDVWLPLPHHVTETMDFTGRWAKERQPQRRPIHYGTWVREGREGRPGFDHTIVQLAMTEGATFSNGHVFAVGVEWSGNPRYAVERQPNGDKAIMAGTVLLPGEVILHPGDTYATPPVAFTMSVEGIDGVSHNFYRWLRQRNTHPTNVRPRPLTLNVWEAVYFGHRLDKLTELAQVAEQVGVERLVLDDGWFGSRRDDKSGLGDWTVSEEVWPDGLGPLIQEVTSRGMEFGLWFEGEMVNPDSDLYRAHPDWILKVPGRVPPEGRNQQVLDFSNPDVFDHIYGQVAAILSDYPISYIKWDHNRVLLDPAHNETPAVITQTQAIYRMFDKLKENFPGLEIESCSSGGARIDLGMVHHADRFWTSDNNEAKERQTIQRYTHVAIPPEMTGTHIGPTASHQTGRVLSLNFRGITALFGHAGIEWDITETTEDERKILATWAQYYKDHRDLLHSGRVYRADQPDDAIWFHGVVAQDKSEALYAYVAMDAISSSTAQRFTLPGLDPDRRYRVCAAFPTGVPLGVPEHGEKPLPEWMSGVVVSGHVLGTLGLRPPIIGPESGFLVEVKGV